MGRVKLSMELIPNERKRNSIFQKRKVGMKKKIYELSTLCNVEVGLVVYGPAQNNNDPLELDIWPVGGEHRILQLFAKFKAQSPEEQKRRTSHLSNYFVDRKNKAQIELAKLQKTNKQAQYPTWDRRYNSLSVDQLRKFVSILKTKLNDANTKYANYAYSVQQQLWWQQQQRSFNMSANKVDPHELFGQTYGYQFAQHGINTFDHWKNPTHISSNEPLVHSYNYQVEQHGISASDRHMDLIPSQRRIMYIHNDDYVGDTSSDKNVVNGPSFMTELENYDKAMKDGMMETIGIVKDVIKAPEMSYNGEAMPRPKYMDYPMWAGGDATPDQLHSEMDHNYRHFDFNNLK